MTQTNDTSWIRILISWPSSALPSRSQAADPRIHNRRKKQITKFCTSKSSFLTETALLENSCWKTIWISDKNKRFKEIINFFNKGLGFRLQTVNRKFVGLGFGSVIRKFWCTTPLTNRKCPNFDLYLVLS